MASSNKFLDIGSTGKPERRAAATSGGAGNENAIPALNASGLLPESMLPAAALDGLTIVPAVAGEALSADDLVQLYDDAGTLKARKADAANGVARPATGRAAASATLGAAVDVYVGPHDYTKTSHGLSIGSENPIFLSAATPGGLTQTPPMSSGQLTQEIGFAPDVNTIYLRITSRGILNNY